MARVILSMCTSLNAVVAREDGQEDWLPSSGWDEFVDDAKRIGNFVMGRETFELVTKLYPDYNFDDVQVGHKVVVTRNEQFVVPGGYLVSHSPLGAIKLLTEAGFQEVLLIGGGKLNAEFFREQLVDEIWLTVNPYLLGRGRSFLAASDVELPLTFSSCKELSGGRVQLRYVVGSNS